jgi:hypothetical protein
MGRPMLAFGMTLLAVAALAQAPAQAQMAPLAPVVKGCVAKEGPAELGGMPTVHRFAKLAGPGGAYRATVEVEGVALHDVLQQAQVKKKVDDGFGRPLDTLVVVRGRSGQVALFSWGELFARNEGGPLLAASLRLRIPSHHDEIEAKTYDRGFLDVAARERLDLKSCQACHAGPEPPRLEVPKGWCLVAPEEGFGGRFVEDVTEISVQQVGISVVADKESGKKPDPNAFVAAPTVVGLDGKSVPAGPEQLGALPRRTFSDAVVGMGRGYRGRHRVEGIDLAAALAPVVGSAGVDARMVWVLVTAQDGYRALYSGSEVFTPRRGEGVLLVESEDGKPLGPGNGRYKSLPTGDFFADRDVRLVKEIRLGIVR